MKKPMLEKKMDTNGNKIVIVRDTESNRSFRVQTNHNLPFLHSLDFLTMVGDDLKHALIEVKIFRRKIRHVASGKQLSKTYC